MLRYLLILTIAVGCGSPQRPDDNQGVFEEDDASATPTSAVPAGDNQDAPPTPARGPDDATNEIRRAALLDVLDRGPAAFLGSIEVKAAFSDKRFWGWEIVRLGSSESSYSDIDLHPGDVVNAVNEHRLERPENLHLLWEELRSSDAIVVTGKRQGGEPFELKFVVADDGAAAP